MRCNSDRQTRLETLLQAKTKQNLSADRCRVVVLSVRKAEASESDTAVATLGYGAKDVA